MSLTDILMTLLTSGLWLIWVLIRNNRRLKRINRNTAKLLKQTKSQL